MRTEHFSVRKQTGKIVLPPVVGNGTILKATLPHKDTEYYQVNATGGYIQDNGSK